MSNQLDGAALRAPPQEAEGPDPAFVALVTAQTELLERNAFRLTRHRADAADLAQDTIEKALRSWRRFTPGSHVRAWLFTIMSHLFIDRCRRRGREVELPGGTEPAVLPPIEEQMATPVWLRLTDEHLRRALVELDPSMREIYQLRAVQQLSYKSMAQRLGIPVATVGTRLNRARSKLRSLLESEMARSEKEERR
jgi:RNA polymerase sigma-70 factor, ECF subfamily